MRQAIEEGFIEDVLKNYVTYKTYYKLLKACNDDPNVLRKKAARALSRYMRLHPHNISQKTVVMVEHFQNYTASKKLARGRLVSTKVWQSRWMGRKMWEVESCVKRMFLYLA